MLRISSRSEVELGTQCLRSLKSAVESTPATIVGTEAREAILKITAVVNATSVVIDPLRDAVNPEAKFLCEQYDRIEKEAARLVDDLTTNAAYTGPRRGSMSTTDKVEHVAKYGSKKFLALPK